MRVTLDVAIAHGVAFVVELLALGEAELNFSPAVFEVHLEGHEGEASLAQLDSDTSELLLVQQELSFAQGFVVVVAGVGVGRDVAVEQKEFAAADLAVRIPEVGAPLAERLDLATSEDEARLEAIFDEIVSERLAVTCHDLMIWIGVLVSALWLLAHDDLMLAGSSALVTCAFGVWRFDPSPRVMLADFYKRLIPLTKTMFAVLLRLWRTPMAIVASGVLVAAIALTGGCATTRHTVSPETAPATQPAAMSPCDAPPAKTGKDPASDYLDIETCPVSPSPEKVKDPPAKGATR